MAFLGWFACLVDGRMPVGMRNAGALALRYLAQADGYALLLCEAYPYSAPLAGGKGTEPQAMTSPLPEPSL